MDPHTLEDKINALPDVIHDHLYDEAIADINEILLERNGLDDTVIPVLATLVKELIVKEVRVEDLQKEVESRFGVDSEKAKKLAMDIAGYRLLPLDVYLGDISGYIRSIGGDPDEYPKTRVKVEERTTASAVDDVENAIALGELPHRLKARFEDAVRSYFKGVRSESQLVDILTRPEKIGGVGLSDDIAEKVVRRAREEKKSVVIEDHTSNDGGKEAASAQMSPPKDVESISSAHERKQQSFVTILPEDEEEIERIRGNLPERDRKRSVQTDVKIKNSVEEIYKAANVGIGSSETLVARFKKIIENRLRDVRDEMETLNMLVQPKELGGLSLTQDDARRVLGLIESKLRFVHERHAKKVGDEKVEWVAKESRRTLERVETEKAAEAKARDAAFRKATRRSRKLLEKTTKDQSMPPANLPVPSGNASAPIPPDLPVRDTRSMTASPSAPTTMSGKGDSARSAVASNQPPSNPVRPAAPPVLVSRPVVRDVTPSAPVATGPIQALRTTTVEDFRRLSKDPNEATLKIKDKIDLLGEESFSKRMQAIAAWRESGVFMLYLQMAKEALNGMPMADVIEKRQNEKKPYLSKEEIGAIVRLSTELRA